MKIHSIKPGECLASLAKQYGFHDPDVIYQHPANQTLRQSRPNMHILQQGDQVCVPNNNTKSTAFESNGQLTLTIKGQVTEFETVIEDDQGEPLANMPYELEVAGHKSTGFTDINGKLSNKIDASAKTGTLVIFLDQMKKNTLTWKLQLGQLPPHDSAIGIQARLNNLGYFCANETGELDPSTKEAISTFKRRHGLTPSAAVDDEFLATLRQEYGF